ncbi:hypothetical protein NLU13_8933 [Sarocladium strictum]|uniref:DUF3500 domain-containing protein n=1 Tax=Sarocladium strictum TaxID=5046 RepID=A0AA39G981_SARSR|nr:hypothetical protein NLU13_8933 [Sarocladium strictum]
MAPKDSPKQAQDASRTYHEFLPNLDQPRFQTMQKQDAHEYAAAFKQDGQPPWLHALYLHWRDLFNEPFRGVTTDGHVKPNLYALQDEGMPIDDIVAAAEAVLALLTDEQRSTLEYHIDSPEWRSWSNPEFLLSDKGLRLDQVSDDLRSAILKLLEATLSPEGYQKALGAMRINGFLGELVQAPRICNEYSYNIVFFGRPSVTRPWGFSFYGHHLCLNIFLHKTQVVMAPWFTGAEPNVIDTGPYQGTQILHAEEALGLQLMQSLDPQQQRTAQVFSSYKDPKMPEGRWNHDDQLHLCGAYRDNRVVPLEGLPVSAMPSEARHLVSKILEQYLLYLPARARQIRLDQCRAWFGETYFTWIGGYGDNDPFYFRIQSPVIIVEFDHHSGVFLTNKEPAKFHIHTILRMPNAGDYGMALRPLIRGMEQDFVWKGEK